MIANARDGRRVHEGRWPRLVVDVDWLGLYLEEDLGEQGDLTSEALFASEEIGAASMVARSAGTVAGLRHAGALFSRFSVHVSPRCQDGQRVQAGSTLLDVRGPVRGILAAERTALNIVGRMSGIATGTAELTQQLRKAGSSAVVAGTRKTTPGFRAFEKEAISIGGGDPHRMGLFDAMMVKDNHIAAAGDVATATRILRAAHPGVLLEVEVESLQDAHAAAQGGADWVLIDNQDPLDGQAWADALRSAHPRLRIEASGGITPATMVAYGWADRISLGSLTHHAVSLDVGLDWGPES